MVLTVERQVGSIYQTPASPWEGNRLRAGLLQTSSGHVNWWYMLQGGWVPPETSVGARAGRDGASAKSVWLITTDAPLQVFRVRSLVLGLEGQTIAPVPHKIAHSCIFNEAWGQMVWNDIIQYLAVLRQRKSSASTTMALYLRGEGRMLPKCPAHICSTLFSDSSRSSWQ